MSKYDEERKKLGLQPVGSTSSFSPINTQSKYAAEREALFNPPPSPRLEPMTVPAQSFNQPAKTLTAADMMINRPKSIQRFTNDLREKNEQRPQGPRTGKLTNVLAAQLGDTLDTLTFGATDKLTDAAENYIRGGAPRTEREQKAADISSIAGTIGAGAGAFRGASALLRPATQRLPGLAERAVNPIASRLSPQAGALTRIGAQSVGRGAGMAATGGAAGALYQAPIEAFEAVNQTNDQSIGERLGDIGESAALGAIIDPVAEGIIGAASSLLRRRGVPEETVTEVLALPAPRERGNANRTQTPDVITDADTRPIGLPEPSLAPPTSARIQRQNNPHRQQFESLISRARQIEAEGRLTPGREDEDLRSLWSQMAGPDSPSLDELIDLAYRPRQNRATPDLVQRARQYQGAREVAGAPLPVRSTQDRYRQGVLGEAAPPVERLGRAPESRQEALNVSPERITPEREAEEVVQAIQQPRIRDRVYNYLDEQEKAARERIARRRGRLSSTPVDEWADYAIIGAAKMGKGTIKLTDWTEEMVKEFGESFRPKAQRAYNAAKEELRKQERRASKEGQAAETFNNSGQGDASTFDAKISRGKKKRRTPFAQRWERLRTQLVDDLAPLEGLERRVRGAVASAEDSLYKAARLFKGTPARAAQVVETRLSPIVQAVEQTGRTADDLGRYALAVHARDVNNAGYKSGFTNAEIEDVIQKLGTPEMEAARRQLVQVNREMMQELVGSGVVSKQLANTLNERWQNYIPLFRSFDDDKVEFGSGLSGALANVASPIKALKGSERAVIDPLENMVKNIFQSVNAAERNKVSGQLAKLAQSDPEGIFIRKLDPDEKVGRKNVVNVKVDGENVKYEVEPEVYKAMLNLDQESSNMLIDILSRPASILRAGATLTPEFSLRNPMRDVLQAFVTSNSGFNPIKDFGAGIIQAITKGDLYKEWVDNLGAYGNVISMDRDVHRQALEKVLKQPPSKKFVNIINGRSLLNLLRAISDTTESATKIGEYRAARRQGQSPQEAAYRSRDLMDFARSGSSVRQANRIIAFLNANIQGKSKLVRAIKNDWAGTTTRMFTAVTLPTVGIYMLNQALGNEAQKQTIAEAPDWQKDTFWLVAIPGTNQVARIPKPFDIAPIFANLPERALQYTQQNDPTAFDGFVQRTLKDGALPFQISGLLPIVEGMANYSFFREGDIIPMREQRLEFRDQYDPTRTTETAKFLARGAEALTGGQGALKNFSSPRIVDNTIRGLTAGLGTYATSAIDAILKNTGLVNRPESPEKRPEQQPLLRAFLVDPMQGGKSMDRFYKNLDKLEKERASARINERRFEKEGLYQYLNDVSSAMSDINKRIREIEASDLLAAEKRTQIDPLVERRNQLAQDAVKRGNLR